MIAFCLYVSGGRNKRLHGQNRGRISGKQQANGCGAGETRMTGCCFHPTGNVRSECDKVRVNATTNQPNNHSRVTFCHLISHNGRGCGRRGGVSDDVISHFTLEKYGSRRKMLSLPAPCVSGLTKAGGIDDSLSVIPFTDSCGITSPFFGLLTADTVESSHLCELLSRLNEWRRQQAAA